MSEPIQLRWPNLPPEVVAVDTETGGFNPDVNPTLSLALVPNLPAKPRILYILPADGEIVEVEAARVNGYTPEKWAARGARSRAAAFADAADFLSRLHARAVERRLIPSWQKLAPLAHNAPHDAKFVERHFPGLFKQPWRCSMAFFKGLQDAGLLPSGKVNLDALLVAMGKQSRGAAVHEADYDAQCAGDGWSWLAGLAKAQLGGTAGT